MKLYLFNLKKILIYKKIKLNIIKFRKTFSRYLFHNLQNTFIKYYLKNNK